MGRDSFETKSDEILNYEQSSHEIEPAGVSALCGDGRIGNFVIIHCTAEPGREPGQGSPEPA